MLRLISLPAVVLVAYMAGFNQGANRGFDLGAKNKQAEVDIATAQLKMCEEVK